MDAERFDTLTRRLVDRRSRRQLLAGVSGSRLAILPGLSQSETVPSDERRKNARRRSGPATAPPTARAARVAAAAGHARVRRRVSTANASASAVPHAARRVSRSCPADRRLRIRVHLGCSAAACFPRTSAPAANCRIPHVRVWTSAAWTELSLRSAGMAAAAGPVALAAIVTTSRTAAAGSVTAASVPDLVASGGARRASRAARQFHVNSFRALLRLEVTHGR
jgi:hypothetical protein